MSRACAPGGLLLACAAAAAAALAIASPAQAAGPHGAKLKLGTETLNRCSRTPLAYCGTLRVPLDRSSPASPQIGISFHFYPATAGPAQGTVVPVEGGPGYPSSESVLYSDGGADAGYAPMYGRLLERWNLLAVDNRGTGGSAALRCPQLQGFSGPTGTSAFQQTVAECAEALNTRWHYKGGAPVHASDLFTTAAAADDMAAVLHALGLSKVDLYGDSYGSFFAQAFAARFPGMLRSLTLDSTYSLVGLDPWYRSSVASMPGDFETACTRAPACAAAEDLPVWTRIGQLAQSLRAKPLSGTVPGAGGREEQVTMDSVGLVDLVNDAAADTQVYRGLDAAARSALEGEPAPLLRLYAQRLAVDEAYFGLPVGEYSVPLYFAVSCLDYPQLFDMGAAPATRATQLAAAEASLPAGTFSPFTTAEWLAQDQNTEAYTACLRWPSPERAEAPAPPSVRCLKARSPCSCSAANWTPGRRRRTSRASCRCSGAMRASSSSPTRRTSSARATPNAEASWSGRSSNVPKPWPRWTPPAHRASRRSTRWASIRRASRRSPRWRRTRARAPRPKRCGLRPRPSIRPATRSRAGRQPKTAATTACTGAPWRSPRTDRRSRSTPMS